MATEDHSDFHTLGLRILQDLSFAFTSTLIYGAFILLFSFSTCTFLRRGLTSRPAWSMFIITVISFCIATVHFIAQIGQVVVIVRRPLVDGISLDADSDLLVYDNIVQWTIGLAPVLSDAVLIWRAWVLFPDRRWIMSVPIALWLGTLVTTFTYLGMFLSPSKNVATEDGSVAIDIFVSSLALSIATNVITTLFIGIKLWSYQKYLVDDLDLKSRSQSPVQKVLLILVESGVIYFCFQIVYFVVGFLPAAGPVGSAPTIALEVFSSVYFGLSTMYPTIIVVLVYNHRSYVDTYDLNARFKNREGQIPSPESRPATLGHLSFATPDTENTERSNVESLPNDIFARSR